MDYWYSGINFSSGVSTNIVAIKIKGDVKRNKLLIRTYTRYHLHRHGARYWLLCLSVVECRRVAARRWTVIIEETRWKHPQNLYKTFMTKVAPHGQPRWQGSYWLFVYGEYCSSFFFILAHEHADIIDTCDVFITAISPAKLLPSPPPVLPLSPLIFPLLLLLLQQSCIGCCAEGLSSSSSERHHLVSPAEIAIKPKVLLYYLLTIITVSVYCCCWTRQQSNASIVLILTVALWAAACALTHGFSCGGMEVFHHEQKAIYH